MARDGTLLLAAGLAALGFGAGTLADVAARCTCRCRGGAVTGVVSAGALTAAAWAVLGSRFGLTPATALDVVFATGLIALGAADLRCRRLPKRWCHVLAAALVVAMACDCLHRADWSRFSAALMAGTVDWAAFGVVWWMARRRGRFGRGDVRLAWLVGAGAAWAGPARTALLLGAMPLAGGCAGALVLAAHQAWRNRSTGGVVPLGPSLAAAAILTVAWGPDALRGMGLWAG